MSGYDGYSMSNRARDAYARGLVPASKIKGVPADLVRQFCSSEEWHHTSSHYNQTEFYDPTYVRAVFGLAQHPEHEPIPAALAALAEAKRGSGSIVYLDCQVKWLDWYGTRRHRKVVEREETGCRVEIKGQTATITLPSGQRITKRLSTRGFSFVQGQQMTDLSENARCVYSQGWNIEWQNCGPLEPRPTHEGGPMSYRLVDARASGIDPVGLAEAIETAIDAKGAHHERMIRLQQWERQQQRQKAWVDYQDTLIDQHLRSLLPKRDKAYVGRKEALAILPPSLLPRPVSRNKYPIAEIDLILLRREWVARRWQRRDELEDKIVEQMRATGDRSDLTKLILGNVITRRSMVLTTAIGDSPYVRKAAQRLGITYVAVDERTIGRGANRRNIREFLWFVADVPAIRAEMKRMDQERAELLARAKKEREKESAREQAYLAYRSEVEAAAQLGKGIPKAPFRLRKVEREEVDQLHAAKLVRGSVWAKLDNIKLKTDTKKRKAVNGAFWDRLNTETPNEA